MTDQTMQQAAAHHFGIAWDELSQFEQAHWEAAYRAGSAALSAENERLKADLSKEQALLRTFEALINLQRRGNARMRKIHSKAVDQLKAENDRLQASLHGYQMGAKAEAEEADRLREKNKGMLEIFADLRASVRCENIHHRTADRHGIHEPCKALARIDAAMAKEARS